ncbi:MAG: ShlB/FhaC/HecB family hemolysin secretion/activation protein [Sterolibacteriaceae bacterium]|uniref:ShlB/FhaC/HecB family hemolysin secretion/activation protein n=1 Tax=Candidatus Methylophosphatis roskildensis TaxID=2899263 RepID=A0A9D7DZE9_9PROT|nr:ShlB/FhaC/HecB family hemolysin secretion/activation protein [Candidatus Methylophosphatis roskildensis]
MSDRRGKLRTIVPRGIAFGVLSGLALPVAIGAVAVDSGGQVEKQFRKPPGSRSAKPRPPTLPQRTKRPAPAGEGVDVSGFQLEGGTVYRQDDLQPMFAPYLGRKVTPEELLAFAEALTDRYHRDGYLLSDVEVPEQSVTDGVVRLVATEGYVAEVRIQGSGDIPLTVFEPFIEPIRTERPATANVLERNLFLMNDLGGVGLASALEPIPGQAGAHVLVINVARDRLAGAVAVDNRGSRSAGPWRGYFDLYAVGLTGHFDETAFRAVTTGDRELNFLYLSHDEPIGSSGARVGVSVNASDSHVTDLGANINLETRSRGLAISASYPLYRTQRANVYMRGTYTAHNGVTDVPGFPVTRDRVRALRLAMTFDSLDSLGGVNLLEVELSRGLRGMGASANDDPTRSRENGRNDFFKTTVYAARLQSIAEHWSILAALNAQYASNNLLVPEQFAFGGDQFGRGYNAAELVGDSGVALKLELRLSGGKPESLPGPYTVYGFYDLGKAWTRSPIEALGEVSSYSASSAGLGVRMNVGSNFGAFVEVAQPLTRDVAERNNRRPRVFGGLSYRF